MKASWDLNEQPVIGVVSQPIDDSFPDDPRFEGYSTYIMAAYVDFLQGSGARVVPLILGEDWDVTLDKINRLDGILFPGGNGDYIEFGRSVYNEVKSMNDQGHFYPLWGTCLGFENMAIWAADEG